MITPPHKYTKSPNSRNTPNPNQTDRPPPPLQTLTRIPLINPHPPTLCGPLSTVHTPNLIRTSSHSSRLLHPRGRLPLHAKPLRQLLLRQEGQVGARRINSRASKSASRTPAGRSCLLHSRSTKSMMIGGNMLCSSATGAPVRSCCRFPLSSIH